MTLQLSKGLVWLTAVIFLLFGLACVVAPAAVIHAATGATVTHPIGLIDLRATYGGMSLGVGAMLALLTTSPQRIRLGLLSVMALMLCMAGGRSLGMLIAGDTNAMMVVYLVLEIAAASIAGLLLRSGARHGAFAAV